MRVGHEPEEEERLSREGHGRIHPWTTSERDPKGRYLDFRQHPELIETCLEDFRPFDNYEGIQQFYRLLKWVNGPTSELETNDGLLRVPESNPDTQIRTLLQIQGRVTVFFREYRRNVSDAAFQWLTDALHGRLASKDNKFILGAIGYSRWPHRFAALLEAGEACDGWVTALRFWAWGNDHRQIFDNLGRVFRNLDEALHYVSAGVRTGAPR